MISSRSVGFYNIFTFHLNRRTQSGYEFYIPAPLLCHVTLTIINKLEPIITLNFIWFVLVQYFLSLQL